MTEANQGAREIEKYNYSCKAIECIFFQGKINFDQEGVSIYPEYERT